MKPQILKAFTTFPPLKVWLTTFASTALLLIVAFFALPGFSDLSAVPSPKTLLVVALVGFFTPALFEEVVFRYFLNWNQTGLSIGISTLLFVLWHPFEAMTFLPAAKPWFTDPGFLTFVGIFGLMSCYLRKLSNSLWPSIVSHWIVVFTWKALGGAQFLT